jgi:hypothetical protein
VPAFSQTLCRGITLTPVRLPDVPLHATSAGGNRHSQERTRQ